jgi:hypothetical protein
LIAHHLNPAGYPPLRRQLSPCQHPGLRRNYP